MKERRIVNMSDAIVSRIKRGSFQFPIQFELFGNSQNIGEAVFDTGCSHSLISVNSLDIGGRSLSDLEHAALMDVDVILAVGAGIESNVSHTKKIRNYVKQINGLKEQLKQCDKSKADCRKVLEMNITPEIEDALSKSKNVRYEYIAHNYSINGMTIGDTNIRLSFCTDHKNLIGMHIIRNLHTKIFSIDSDIFMVSALDNSSLDDAEKEICNAFESRL